VFADDCLIADALTKVLYTDPERASPLLDRYRARAVILEPDEPSGDCRIFDSAA
jgi:thiamine biosynthesis lipoprotein